MPEREGFHLKTRSVMKQLLEDAKWMVLADKSFEWMCGVGRTISPRTEQREQVWVLSGVIVSSTRTGSASTHGHMRPQPSVSIMTACAPGLVGSSCRTRCAIFPEIDFVEYINL